MLRIATVVVLAKHFAAVDTRIQAKLNCRSTLCKKLQISITIHLTCKAAAATPTYLTQTSKNMLTIATKLIHLGLSLLKLIKGNKSQ